MNAIFLLAVLGSSNADGLVDGATAYRRGLQLRDDSAKAQPHFVQAAERYEQAWSNGHRTVAVAHNMAQARILAGDPGRAIRNYRLGLQVFPHDVELQRGLTYIRERIAYAALSDIGDQARQSGPMPIVDRLPLRFSAMVWITIGLAGIAWTLLARAFIAVRVDLAIVAGVGLMAALVSGLWLWSGDRSAREHWSQPTAVVIGAGTEIRTGNSHDYPRRLDGRLPAGVELTILGRRGGWLHVELAGGPVGWIPANRAVETGIQLNLRHSSLNATR